MREGLVESEPLDKGVVRKGLGRTSMVGNFVSPFSPIVKKKDNLMPIIENFSSLVTVLFLVLLLQILLKHSSIKLDLKH